MTEEKDVQSSPEHKANSSPKIFSNKENRDNSFYEQAIKAGIGREMSGIELLHQAWGKATLKERQTFLNSLRNDLEATLNGVYQNTLVNLPPEPEIPEEIKPAVRIEPLERLLENGADQKIIARFIEVPDTDLEGWRAGTLEPSEKHLAALKKMCLDFLGAE